MIQVGFVEVFVLPLFKLWTKYATMSYHGTLYESQGGTIEASRYEEARKNYAYWRLLSEKRLEKER